MVEKIKTIQDLTLLTQSSPFVLITGSFDLMHLGHLRFIHKVKQMFPSQKLVLILLSDKSISARKGANRPLFPEKYRLEFASYLQDVDYVAVWEQSWEKLRDFVLEIKPEIYVVNSDDPGIENKREIMEQAGGHLVVLQKSDDYSTSKIINKIKAL